MSRLYGAEVDEKKWEIIEIDNSDYHTYKLVDKETKKTYFLKKIIGIEQVAENEFLIYKRSNYDEFMITRYKLENFKFQKIFDKKFSNFDFINDDRILFRYTDRSAKYRCSGIYSIKDNNYVDDGKWLDGNIIDIYEDEGKIKLFVQIIILSHVIGNQELFFTVDPNSLEPNSSCYSLLRNRFIDVKTKEDIFEIKKEDQKYADVISNYIFEQKRLNKEQAKEKLLKNT